VISRYFELQFQSVGHQYGRLASITHAAVNRYNRRRFGCRQINADIDESGDHQRRHEREVPNMSQRVSIPFNTSSSSSRDEASLLC